MTVIRGPAVEVVAVSKSFSRTGAHRVLNWRHRRRPRRLALDDVSLSVEMGQVLGVIGANGSGKSTLIRIISTLLLPDAGHARVFGSDIVREPRTVQRHLNRVSVEASFFKELSPWENLAYAARLYGSSGAGRRARTVETLQQLGLPPDCIDRPMKDLSRGQQQKVAIARSVLTTPMLLLMDEPTTGLDPRSKREVQALVRDIRRRTGVTVLLSTHDLDEAEILCDRVVILDQGRIVAAGSPDELRRGGNGDTPAKSLEDVFMQLTGKSLQNDVEEGEGVA